MGIQDVIDAKLARRRTANIRKQFERVGGLIKAGPSEAQFSGGELGRAVQEDLNAKSRSLADDLGSGPLDQNKQQSLEALLTRDTATPSSTEGAVISRETRPAQTQEQFDEERRKAVVDLNVARGDFPALTAKPVVAETKTLTVKPVSRFAKPQVKDFTPASIQVFRKTGNESDLREKPKDKLTPTQLILKAKGDSKKAAQDGVKTKLTEIKGLYVTLQKTGGIIDTEAGVLANIGNWIQSSYLGQTVGKRVGTVNQSLRTRVNNLRPLLLNDIRKATEQGARGLDSNKELDFYVQAATNPQLDVQSNFAAINVLARAYTGADKDIGLSLEDARRIFVESGGNINDATKLFVPSALPEGVTEDDIRTTMRKNKMTRKEVLLRLQGGR